MKGLLRNNYYSMQENMILSVLIALVMGVIAILVWNPFLMIAISIAVLIFPINIGASLQADEASKWNKFEVTMPVSRKTVVQCKYISYLMLVLIGTLCSLVIVLAYILLGHQIDIEIIIFSYLNAVTMAMLTGALMHPLILKLGALKSELIIVVSVILSMGCTAIIGLGMEGIGLIESIQVSRVLVNAFSAIVSIILFVASFFISVRIHDKKEF